MGNQDTIKMAPSSKKTFETEGQTKETPPVNSPLRKFYVSLLRQNKNSKMAMAWCKQHGIANNTVHDQIIKATKCLSKLSIKQKTTKTSDAQIIKCLSKLSVSIKPKSK